ncbi:eukaryotic translation initiation factor SUI1 family protein [Mycena rebaudengoi]|nr:eukaryotic translation initiation factor SUI1 family protein [Mycena rebaudengoi]
MFKKPLSSLKTSSPLRSSDRRKLKQRVLSAHGLSSEDGDLLVPDGILSVKFSTHLDEPGVAYLSPDGDPLWFSVGKGSEDLIPTVYTMWKRPTLLPFLSTPAAVIPVLVGGADLMIPGVVHHTPSLNEGQLVSISQYTHGENPTLSAPLAVGHMALPSDQIENGRKEKGKAVYILHTWKDHLWDMGSKPDLPEPTAFASEPERQESPPPPSEDPTVDDGASPVDDLAAPAEPPPAPTYTAGEISTLLHASLLQAISATLAQLPSSAFPLSASVFYESYILPYRPAFPTAVVPLQGVSSPDSDSAPSPQDITIKNSAHKSLTAFLKASEKAGLLALKAPGKHAQQTEVVVTSVNAALPAVAGHHSFVTVKDLELRAAKKAVHEERLKEAEEDTGKLVEAKELWKPHLRSLELFEALGGSPKSLYDVAEVRTLLNGYITTNALVNAAEQAYINLDARLAAVVAPAPKIKNKFKGQDAREPPPVEFMKRDELTKNVLQQMQAWYEVKAPGKDPVVKKGALKPIQVAMKIRQGRKASTLVTGFEPFLVLSGEEMAEDLRKICAGATSVSPRSAATPGLEVLVQGKQSKVVFDYLIEKGIPKKWIEVLDLVKK